MLAPSEQFLQAQNQVFNPGDLEEDTILDVIWIFFLKLILCSFLFGDLVEPTQRECGEVELHSEAVRVYYRIGQIEIFTVLFSQKL